MAEQDFLKPKGLNPDQLFHERAERVRFVNPPGYEFTQRDKRPDIDGTGKPPASRGVKAREKFFGTQVESMAVKGRPI
jgi:hypothetical protein